MINILNNLSIYKNKLINKMNSELLLEYLPYEKLLEIAWNLTYDDIMHLCQTSNVLDRICEDDYFWKKKLEKDFDDYEIDNELNFRKNYENVLSVHILTFFSKYKNENNNYQYMMLHVQVPDVDNFDYFEDDIELDNVLRNYNNSEWERFGVHLNITRPNIIAKIVDDNYEYEIVSGLKDDNYINIDIDDNYIRRFTANDQYHIYVSYSSEKAMQLFDESIIDDILRKIIIMKHINLVDTDLEWESAFVDQSDIIDAEITETGSFDNGEFDFEYRIFNSTLYN